MEAAPKPGLEDNRAKSRMVVLLRAAERKKLDRLATREKVSAAEIVRRSINSYESAEARGRKEEEERIIGAALRLVAESLSGANESAATTIAKLDKLHGELIELDQR